MVPESEENGTLLRQRLKQRLGGLVIGMVRALGSAYVGEKWTSALIFGILILILVFRPAGLLGSPRREKV